MASKSSKRSPDVCVSSDGKKKKKISVDKCDMVVPKDKTTAACDGGHSRQKKAFFAYFGKTLMDKDKKVELINDKPNTRINYVEIQMPFDKYKKKSIEKKNNTQYIHNKVIENTNLPYVSSFVEELGCFPKITHTNWLAPLKNADFRLSLNKETLYVDELKNSLVLFQSSSSKPERLILKSQHVEINFPYMISSIKKSIPNFPVSNYHKYMKKKCLLANKSTANIQPMWIEKYKPMCEEEVLGNSELIKRLKKWLMPIKEKSKKCKTYHSDDDYIFESDSDSSSKVQHNLAILLGPSGCGKTSAVYAVANELNANVIELNASCNRNGKRIITDLMEATQSHAVEKICLFNLIKEKNKKIKKLKKRDIHDKMTVILIEDADILFENYDDGYLSAISTLVTDSKRPLILTANDRLSDHLLKFFETSKMILNFVHPPKQHLNCFLQLMALNEGVILSEDEIKTFVHPLKPDIKQSILQLQYILSTGEIVNKTFNSTYKRCINSIWWNWPFVLSGCDLIKIENDKQANCKIDIATISNHLDALSKLNLIYSKTQSDDFLDPQPFWDHIATRDSSSLIETNHWSDNSVQLSTDIFQWIHNRIITQNYNDDKLYPTPEELSCRQRIWNIYKDILEQIGVDFCNRKSVTCLDYMATIRSLGRNQQENQSFLNLRHLKMFSYLRRINIEVDSDDLKYLCDSFQSDSNCYEPVNICDKL